MEKTLALGGGYAVQVCASGGEAVAQAGSFRPDLILLDVQMPGLDGPGTLTALRALPATAETPVVFLTATSEASKREALLALGAIAVLPKPFSPERLPGEIQSIWAAAHEGKPERSELESALGALRVAYARTLPEEAKHLNLLGRCAFGPSGTRENLETFRIATHGLHGSGASFGFDAITDAASQLEAESERLLEAGVPAAPAQRAKVLALLGALERAARDAAQQPDAAPGGGVAVAPAGSEAPPAQRGSAGRAKQRLLVVDDVESVRVRYALALRAGGFEVDVASGGEEALALAQLHPYDLILLDVRMPAMDGFEVQRRLREATGTRQTPILMMSISQALGMAQIKAALERGVSGFAPKSMSLPALVQKVREALPAAQQQAA